VNAEEAPQIKGFASDDGVGLGFGDADGLGIGLGAGDDAGDALGLVVAPTGNPPAG
jgi:hypothetical protein